MIKKLTILVLLFMTLMSCQSDKLTGEGIIMEYKTDIPIVEELINYFEQNDEEITVLLEEENKLAFSFKSNHKNEDVEEMIEELRQVYENENPLKFQMRAITNFNESNNNFSCLTLFNEKMDVQVMNIRYSDSYNIEINESNFIKKKNNDNILILVDINK